MTESRESTVPLGRHGSQFSLRAILIAIGVLAIFLSLWVSYRRSEEVKGLQAEIKQRDKQIESHQAEIRQLKAERGELAIDPKDRDKINVISAPSVESMLWKWRLYIPAGRKFCLDSYTTSSNTTAMHRPDESMSNNPPLKSGEISIVVALRKDEAGNWQWIISYDGSESRHLLSRRESSWIDRNSPISIESAGNDKQEVMKLGESLRLFRYRSFAKSLKDVQLDDFGDGIEVWIRELKPAKH
jgi:hypothetical protein